MRRQAKVTAKEGIVVLLFIGAVNLLALALVVTFIVGVLKLLGVL